MAENKKVLLIDDEPDFLETLQKALVAKAYNVICCVSKEEGQEMLDQEPDVIVLGTLAPAGQAFAMQKWLKENPKYKDIPLMVIDARYEERAIRGWRRFEGMQLECEAYASKPIEPASLVLRIHGLLGEALRPKLIRVLIVDDHNSERG